MEAEGIGVNNRYMDFYAGKQVLITGGSGSIGTVIVHKLVDAGAFISVLSRDETKQSELDNSLASRPTDLGGILPPISERHFRSQEEWDRSRRYPKNTRYIIGDVRDHDVVDYAVKGQDIVIHAAAMKHVDKCAQNPSEAIKTNIIGAMNVQMAIARYSVDTCIVVSTDKAANPFGMMGLTKRVQELLFLDGYNGSTKVKITRFGNVLGSRGSVVPVFRKLIAEGKSIQVTNPAMKRFFMTMDEGADLVLFAGSQCPDRSITVKQMKYAQLGTLVEALDIPDDKIERIGMRPGEKIEEQLVADDELTRIIAYNQEDILGSWVGVIYKEETAGAKAGGNTDKLKERFSTTYGGMTVEELRQMIARSGA